MQIAPKYYAQIFLSLTLSALGAVASVLLLSTLNQQALSAGSTGLEANMPKLVLLIAGLFLTNALSQLVLAQLSSSVVAGLRMHLSRKFIALEYSRMEAIGRQEVTTSLVNDVARMSQAASLVPLIAFQALSLALCTFYLGTLSMSLLFVWMASMTGAVSIAAIFMHKGGKQLALMRDLETDLHRCYDAIGTGKKELILNRSRSNFFMKSEIGPNVAAVERVERAALRWTGFGGSWATSMIFAAMLLSIYAGYNWLQKPSSVVLQYMLVTLYLVSPMTFLINAAPAMAQGAISYRKLKSLGVQLASPSIAAPAGTGQPLPEDWKELILDSAVYAYNQQAADSGFQLGPISLQFSRGQIYFIVGGNGSGKSSLLKILTGLVVPTSGQVRLGEIPIDSHNLENFRQLFSAIFFDFHVFKRLLDSEGHAAQTLAVDPLLHKMGLTGKVSYQDKSLSTTDVSSGQKRRLAMVQSLLEDKDIVIFDEWAADQDGDFKQYFYREILPYLKSEGKLVIAVTHDSMYYDCADFVVYMEQGKLCDPAHQAKAWISRCIPAEESQA